MTTAHGGGNQSLDVFLLAAPGKFGLLSGIVSDKAPATAGKPPEWIEITDDRGEAAHYTPQWTGKSFDAEMLQAFNQRLIGDRVEIRWTEDDHRRLSTMRILAMSNQAAPGDAGTVSGRAIEKGKDWLILQTDDGERERFVPQRIVGGNGERDKTVLRPCPASRSAAQSKACGSTTASVSCTRSNRPRPGTPKTRKHRPKSRNDAAARANRAKQRRSQGPIHKRPAKQAAEVVRIVQADDQAVAALLQLAGHVGIELETIVVHPPDALELAVGDLLPLT